MAVLLAMLAMLAAMPAAAQPARAPDKATEHVVKPGETLMGIANRAKVPRVLIAEANGLKPPYTVRAGQKLRIPRTRRHTVGRGETGFSIAFDHGVRWRDIAVANGIDPEAAIEPGQKLLIPTVIPATAALNIEVPPIRFAWPLAGAVRRGFIAGTAANRHDGLDIRAPLGTAVRAAAAGRIILAGEEPRQFGKLVLVDHGGGWQSAYGFLRRVTVRSGDPVAAGERIGLVGNTGRAKGNELHFELRRNNAAVDPRSHLPERP